MNSPINFVLDLLYPKENICAACGAPGAQMLCAKCRASLTSPAQSACPVCGRRSAGGLCGHCRAHQSAASGGIAAYDYRQAAAAAVTALKFQDRQDYAPALAHAIARWGGKLPLAAIDAITAVPIHPLRRLRRGFNQSELLARELSAIWGIPYLPDALRRPGYARPAARYGINDARRLHAAQRSFARGKADVAGMGILLVDDVLTSGATLRTCAALLRNDGARQVFTAVAAAVPDVLDNRQEP